MSITEIVTKPDRGPLIDLAEDLGIVLSLIAYDGKSEDPQYIEQMQRELRVKYSGFVKGIRPTSVDASVLCRWGQAVSYVVTAYDGLQDMMHVGERKAKSIAEEAEGLLQGYLIQPYVEDFS